MGRPVTLVSAARRMGRTHARCDDRFHFAHRGGWSVAALSDGAGSKPLSSEGAKIATRTVCSLLPELLSESGNIADSLRTLPFRVRLAIALRYFPAFDLVDIGDFAGTLLFAALHGESGEWIVGHLGDGVAACVDGKNRPFPLSHPDNGEYANVTYFYTDADASERLRLYRVTGIRGVALMSDGTARSLYRAKDGAVSPALSRLFGWQKELGAAKGSSMLRRNIDAAILPRTDDDCSLVLLQTRKSLQKSATRIDKL